MAKNDKTIKKVSIIIPIYNAEKHLKRCLDSLVNQTLKEIEIICVNDGSTDSSLDILNEYKEKDSRIVVISQKNGGESTARNSGYQIAKGEYIAFVDADDYVDLATYKECYDMAKPKDVDILSFYMEVDYGDKKIMLPNQKDNMYEKFKDNVFDINDYPIELFTDRGGLCAVLLKREFLKESNFSFPVGYSNTSDMLTIYNLFYLSKKVAILNKVFYHYDKTIIESSSKDNKRFFLTAKCVPLVLKTFPRKLYKFALGTWVGVLLNYSNDSIDKKEVKSVLEKITKYYDKYEIEKSTIYRMLIQRIEELEIELTEGIND